MKQCFFIFYFVLFSSAKLIAQNCELPVLSSIHSFKVDGFTIDWLDFNSDPESWEIEFGLRDFQRDFVADISGIDQLSYTFNNLMSGTTYEIYIRAVCATLGNSGWNGPYFINTAIDNQSSCNLDLRIGDNNCPKGRDFFIYIDSPLGDSLGIDLVLDKLELVVDHPWPPDLELELRNPQGETILLSSFNGNGTDDYGNSNDNLCTEKFIFSDNACQFISEAEPPFIGEYKPEEAFTKLFNAQSPNGLWILNICDRAAGDLGNLIHAKMIFSEEACVVPQSFQIINVESNFIEVLWDHQEKCQNLQISYKKVGAPITETFSAFVECMDGSYTIPDLSPDTDYELYIISICGADSNSPQSCLYHFSTSCQNSNLQSSFDELPNCTNRCDATCPLDMIWENDRNNDANWIVNDGSTPTELTGPEGDINFFGKYIYIENQKENCPGDVFSTLLSTCLVHDMVSDCSLSFYYSMFGEDIAQLLLQYSTDSVLWQTIWSKNGNQGEDWRIATVKLTENFSAGRLRFVAQSKSNALRGDIALDNIKLIAFDKIPVPVFYRDSDGDGFGNPEERLASCRTTPPSGYVINGMDCDDADPKIHPGANEISCNMLDENCNGMDDDISPNDIDYQILNVRNESCKGESDGSIEIIATQGQGGFEYQWSNGENTPKIENLPTGVYYCTITDGRSCQTVTDPIVVDFEEILLYTVLSVNNTVCTGLSTGSISILAAGGLPPYSISWDNGLLGSVITGLKNGAYTATITDFNGCKLITEPIIVSGPQVVTTGVALKSDLDCYNENTGFIQLGIVGGKAPYSIKWNNGATSSFINQLAAGTYSVTVEDSNGCTDVVEGIKILEPKELSVAINNVESLNCFAVNNGQIDIHVTGGQEPYSYFWSNGAFSQDLHNVGAGLYNVTVTDFKACRKELNNILVQQNSELKITLDSINFVDCKGSTDGYISVLVSGGTSPYSYNWSTDDGNGSDERFIKDLLPGKYFLTVVDKLSCKSRASTFEVVNLNVPINIDLTILDSLDCFNETTAKIKAQGLRGSPPFDYNWSSGKNTIRNINRDTLSMVGAGTYNLTITDNEGCLGISDSISIAAVDEINYNVIKLIPNQCSDGNSGEIELVISGGNDPYETVWSNGNIGTKNISLKNGNYTATITDQNGCRVETLPISISSPPVLSMRILLEGSSAQGTGAIIIIPEGGTPPYEYHWDDPLNFVTDSIADNLISGTYSLTISDSFGCSQDTIINLSTVSTLNTQHQGGILLYPIPANEFCIVEFKDEHVADLKLYNIQGEELHFYYNKISQNQITIETSNLINGVYVLDIKTKKWRYPVLFTVLH